MVLRRRNTPGDMEMGVTREAYVVVLGEGRRAARMEMGARTYWNYCYSTDA